MLGLFCSLFFYKFVRLVVNALSRYTFQPVPLPREPTFQPEHVTVVIPTICEDGDLDTLQKTLESCHRARPRSIIVVASSDREPAVVERVNSLKSEFSTASLKVLSCPVANKRQQVRQGILQVKTDIVVLADDDVEWPAQEKFLPALLAPFNDPKVGAVGTRQRVVRRCWRNIWEYLGACYIERRKWDCAATVHIDGGLSCLSGRTGAFRTEILQASDFLEAYCSETWRGHLLNPDDDNFITRHIDRRDWSIYLQFDENAVVNTTLELNYKFLYQCLRWARSRWRNNLTTVFFEFGICRRHPWTAFSQFFHTPLHSLVVDPLLLYTWHMSKELITDSRLFSRITYALLVGLLFTKIVKLLGHYRRYPLDILLVPFQVIFWIFHGPIHFYALFTLSETSWGSRQTAHTKTH